MELSFSRKNALYEQCPIPVVCGKIDWEHGSPYIWQDHDYQTLINSNKIFARKFNSNQMGVVYKIQKLYLKQVPK